MRYALYLMTFILLVGCNALSEPTPTPTNTPTETPLPTVTATPSLTPTATITPSATPSPIPTETPTATYTPSITPTASVTPQPTIGFSFDSWQRVEIPNSIRAGVTSPLVVYTNSNNQSTIGNIATPGAENRVQTLYAISPNSPLNRIQLLQMDASTGNQIYLSRNGKSLAYLQPTGNNFGLYIISLENGYGGRVLPVTSLTQRGITSLPVWSPNGEQLALTLDTGYALDIFLYDRNGAGRTNVSNSPASDFYPTWSPDGRYLAFVSDRNTCPSWTPADAGFCDVLTQPAPVGGNVFVLNISDGTIRQVGEMTTTEPPRWVNNRLIAIAEGDISNILNPQRTLWLGDAERGTATPVLLNGDSASNTLYLSDVWSPDGSALVFQRITPSTTSVVMMGANGTLVRERTEDLGFPRFGMSATWSPLNDRIAFGGLNGLCPYGVRVADRAFDWVATGNPPPSMCSPQFSADGQWLAFSGVNPRVDGRDDIYISTSNGFSAVNLTVDLRGQMQLIGWMGGVP